VLNGLSVYDGSMATSVARRRVLWHLAGVALLVVAAGLLATTWISLPWTLGEMRDGAVLIHPLAACACALEGVRLLRHRRHSRASRRLHRWSIGCWIATAFAVSPLLVLCWLPSRSQRPNRNERVRHVCSG
jgi:hypothetical protein